MIDSQTVQTIFDTTDIVEVIDEFTTLKKKGSDYWACCPFHNEKTPSFHVVPSRGIYKCFGCGAGGNAVNFLMELEKYSYPEALRFLAKKYNIEIEEKEQTPEEIVQQNERESLFIVSEFAERYFTQQLLNTEEGKAIGLSYLKERGFSDKVIEKFKLGYCPDGGGAFTNAAQAEGYELEYLLKTGLTKEHSGRHYDGYRGRVMFPIHNLGGRVIAFGGRTLKSDKKAPKYINSPESQIYNKSRVLFGIHQARKTIAKEENCLLVEGYTDVTSLHQAGIENVVASSGTALTTDQIRLIKRFTKNITILYDGDAAGIKASFRGIDLILEEGMTVKVVLFPEGEDPDSFSKTRSPEEVKEFIRVSAKDFVLFKTDLLFIETQDDPIRKSELIHEIINSVALIPDQIARTLYVQQCSKILEIPEKALLSELNKVRVKKLSKERRQRLQQAEIDEIQHPSIETNFGEQPTTPDSIEPQENDLIRLLLNYHDKEIEVDVLDNEGNMHPQKVTVGMFIANELAKDGITFDNPAYQKILNEINTNAAAQKPLTEKFFTHHQDHEIQQVAIDFLSSKYELHNWERKNIPVRQEKDKLQKGVFESLYSYRSKRVLQLIAENVQKIKEAHNSGEDVIALQKRNIKLNQIKKMLTPLRAIIK